MITFQYQARSSDGKFVKGEIEALHEQEALDKLWARSLLTISLRASGQGAVNKLRLRQRVPSQDLVVFTRQFATMLKAGLPLVQALSALKRQSRKKKKMVSVVEGLGSAIEQGFTTTQALAQYPRVFNRLYTSMVSAGETGGILPEVLDRVATYLESSMRLRRKVRSAMAYPVVVSVMALGISLFLILKIIPVFGEIYKDMGAQLPAPTQMLIHLSDTVKHNFWEWSATILGLGCAFMLFKRTPAGTLCWDHVKLRVPVIGTLARKICLSRFSRTTASLLRSGVPIMTTLRTVAQSAGNRVLEDAVQDIFTDIEAGKDFATALTRHSIFPAMLIEMVAAGEQTGKVAEMLEQVANYYDEEVEAALNGLTALIEPLLIAYLGVVIGGIVVAMFLPIFRLSQIVQF